MHLNQNFIANVIFVDDVIQAEAWYSTVFGMTTVNKNLPEFIELSFNGHKIYIETVSHKRAKGLEGKTPGGRLSIVFGVSNINRFFDNAIANGAKPIVYPVRQFFGGINAVIADPFGNELILDEMNLD